MLGECYDDLATNHRRWGRGCERVEMLIGGIMKNLVTKGWLWILAILLTAFFWPEISSAAPQWNRNITVEWAYDTPADLSLTGFKLYQEGQPTCEWSVPIARIGTCDVVLTTKITRYTLAALFSDGQESPRSEPYLYIDWGPKPRIINVTAK